MIERDAYDVVAMPAWRACPLRILTASAEIAACEGLP
jgi:hypothetical protein